MIQLLLNGLAMGAIYSLVALGFVVIANAVNVVNFAQGENVMLGAYVAAWLTLTLHVPLLAAYIISIASIGRLWLRVSKGGLLSATKEALHYGCSQHHWG